MTEKPLERAIQIAGSQVKLAAALGVRQGHVWKWLNTAREGVPAKYCPEIERLTRREVTCEELRPDIDWGYVRGSKKAEAVPVFAESDAAIPDHAYPEPVHDDRRAVERRDGDRRVRGEQRVADRRAVDRRDGRA